MFSRLRLDLILWRQSGGSNNILVEKGLHTAMGLDSVRIIRVVSFSVTLDMVTARSNEQPYFSLSDSGQ